MEKGGQSESDLEIGDVESYGGGKDQAFSHQVLVMIAMKKCIEYGTMEQVPGMYLTEQDKKGNTKVIYRQDTRRAFIESVRTLKMVMICDFDKDAKTKINELIHKTNTRKKELITEQENWWEGLKPAERNFYLQKGFEMTKGSFNTQLPFFQNYLSEELQIYREIFEQLSLLTERVDFYKSEDFEA